MHEGPSKTSHFSLSINTSLVNLNVTLGHLVTMDLSPNIKAPTSGGVRSFTMACLSYRTHLDFFCVNDGYLARHARCNPFLSQFELKKSNNVNVIISPQPIPIHSPKVDKSPLWSGTLKATWIQHKILISGGLYLFTRKCCFGTVGSA